MEVIVDYTEGYPYFIQEYGKIVWDLAPENEPISRRIAQEAQRAVEAKLDESFFQYAPNVRPGSSFSTCARWPSSARVNRPPAKSRP